MADARDDGLAAVHSTYANALASGAGSGLYAGYLEQRGSVIDRFILEAIALRKQYSEHDPGGALPLPETPSPVPAFPRPGQYSQEAATQSAPQLHSWQTPVPLLQTHPDTGTHQPSGSTLKRRGLLILGIAAAVVGVLAIINWYVYASQGPTSYSSSSGSSTSSTLTSTTRTVTYEVVGSATGATITYQAPTGTAQASIKVPLATKSGEKVSFEMDRGDFVYISAQNKGTSGNIICRISVAGKVISTVTSSGAYAIASCDGTVP